MNDQQYVEAMNDPILKHVVTDIQWYDIPNPIEEEWKVTIQENQDILHNNEWIVKDVYFGYNAAYIILNDEQVEVFALETRAIPNSDLAEVLKWTTDFKMSML